MAGSITPEKTDRNRNIFEDYCKYKLGEMTMVDLIVKYEVTDTRIEQVALNYAKKNGLEIPERKEVPKS